MCVGRYERAKVADVDQVLHFMTLKPLISNRKVIVIDNANDITWEAANRLLKPLEEPPEGFFIFLISSNPDAILPTLRGRCVTFEFQGLKSEDIINVLYKKMDFDLSQARTIGWMAAGMAVDIFSKAGQYLQCRDSIVEFLGGIRSRNIIACLDFVDKFERHELSVVCDVMVALMTDVTLLNAGIEQIINMDVRDALKKLASECKGKALVYVVDQFSQVKKNAYLNVNLNMALKSAFIKTFPYIIA
jgi:DNA polymerase-3 subunit delta'